MPPAPTGTCPEPSAVLPSAGAAMLLALLVASGTFWELWLALSRAPPACPIRRMWGPPLAPLRAARLSWDPVTRRQPGRPFLAPPPSERPAHRQALRDPDSSVFCQHRLFQEAKPFPRNIFKHMAPTERPLNRAGERSPHTSERLWAVGESSAHWEVGSWNQQLLSAQGPAGSAGWDAVPAATACVRLVLRSGLQM